MRLALALAVVTTPIAERAHAEETAGQQAIGAISGACGPAVDMLTRAQPASLAESVALIVYAQAIADQFATIAAYDGRNVTLTPLDTILTRIDTRCREMPGISFAEAASLVLLEHMFEELG